MYDYKNYAPGTTWPQGHFIWANSIFSAPLRSQTDITKIFESPK